jgi:hypothetical protein
MPYQTPSFLQPGVYAEPGSELYRQRVAYNQSRGYTGAIPGLETGIASGVNRFMTQQAQLPFVSNLPLYSQMRGQQSQNIMSMLQGDVPGDVINQIMQQAAERGIATGSPGGPGANSAYLKALGLTSLGLQQQGSQLLGGAIEQTPVPQLWNPISLYVPERTARKELEVAQTSAAKPWQRFGEPSGWSSGSSWGW